VENLGFLEGREKTQENKKREKEKKARNGVNERVCCGSEGQHGLGVVLLA